MVAINDIDKIIMIIGTMGSGKSSVGRKVASALGLPFKDSDAEVEAAAGCSVKDFFEIYGEEKFRDCEQRVIKRLLSGPLCVLSSGGGSFVSPEVRQLAKEKALTIWLKADEEVLFNRLKGRSRRPQVPCDENELKHMVHELLITEATAYAEADIIIESLDEPTHQTAQKVISAISANL